MMQAILSIQDETQLDTLIRLASARLGRTPIEPDDPTKYVLNTTLFFRCQPERSSPSLFAGHRREKNPAKENTNKPKNNTAARVSCLRPPT